MLSMTTMTQGNHLFVLLVTFWSHSNPASLHSFKQHVWDPLSLQTPSTPRPPREVPLCVTPPRPPAPRQRAHTWREREGAGTDRGASEPIAGRDTLSQ